MTQEKTSRGMPHRIARSVGDYGERVAARHLAEQGMQIIDRNWRCDAGEVDIVAMDGPCLVICEVKTRRSATFGSPLQAVTPRKAARLRRLAARWLADHDVRVEDVRVDVIGVWREPTGPARLEHVVGAA